MTCGSGLVALVFLAVLGVLVERRRRTPKLTPNCGLLAEELET